MIVIDVCLNDIPEGARKKASNGKTYTKLVVDERKEKDAYGNTHSVYVNQSREDRQNKVKKDYVGSGVEYIFNNQSSKPDAGPDKQGYSDGLPF